MDFGFTQEQQDLWHDMVDFARNDIEYNLVERDANQIFLESNWKAIADKGLLGLCLPQEYGGLGYDITTSIHALEGFGYGCPDNGLTLALCSFLFAVTEPIYRFGNDQQKRKYLPSLIDGSQHASLGLTEPVSGSDALGLHTTATKVDGGYVINGRKTYIGFAPVADVFVVLATINPELGRWGVSAFLVDGDTDNIIRGDSQSTMGLRTNPMGELEFKDVFVPQENLLGREGSGVSLFNTTMVYERSFIFASHVGSMARQLDETIEFAKKRVVGGSPIGTYQSISNRIANMKVRLETARMFLYKAAWLVDQGKKASMEASMTKLVLSELFLENSLDAVRIHGGQGYLAEHGIERDLRDAVGGVIYSGTSDIQRNMIARLLGL